MACCPACCLLCRNLRAECCCCVCKCCCCSEVEEMSFSKLADYLVMIAKSNGVDIYADNRKGHLPDYSSIKKKGRRKSKKNSKIYQNGGDEVPAASEQTGVKAGAPGSGKSGRNGGGIEGESRPARKSGNSTSRPNSKGNPGGATGAQAPVGGSGGTPEGFGGGPGIGGGFNGGPEQAGGFGSGQGYGGGFGAGGDENTPGQAAGWYADGRPKSVCTPRIYENVHQHSGLPLCVCRGGATGFSSYTQFRQQVHPGIYQQTLCTYNYNQIRMCSCQKHYVIPEQINMCLACP